MYPDWKLVDHPLQYDHFHRCKWLICIDFSYEAALERQERLPVGRCASLDPSFSPNMDALALFFNTILSLHESIWHTVILAIMPANLYRSWPMILLCLFLTAAVAHPTSGLNADAHGHAFNIRSRAASPLDVSGAHAYMAPSASVLRGP